MHKPIFKRVMVKLSGEALMGKQGYGIDYQALNNYLKQLLAISDMGVEVIVEVGGGNIYRWRTAQFGINREAADTMGMMGSIMNAINFAAVNPKKVKAMSAVDMKEFIDLYTVREAKRYMVEKYIVVIGGGLGNQFFTTDTGAVIHALQTDCEVVLKGTNVDGVYDQDPNKFKAAKKYKQVGYDEVLSQNLNVMDMSAFALCRENKIPVIVFNIEDEGSIKKIILGEKVGTIVK